MFEVAINDDSMLLSENLFSIIEECAASCKQIIPTDSRTGLSLQADSRRFDDLADHFHLRIILEWQVLQSRLRCLLLIRKLIIYLIMNKIRSFFGINAVRHFHIMLGCLSAATEERIRSRHILGSKVYSLALSSSDKISSGIRDLSTEDVARCNPYLAYSRWVPSCLQQLVKLFTRADPELAEKASLSLKIFTMTLEIFAESSGLGQLVLSMLQPAFHRGFGLFNEVMD